MLQRTPGRLTTSGILLHEALSMHSTQRDQPVPTVLVQWFSQHNIPLWRYVGPREDGLEQNFARMSPEVAAELRSQCSKARCALEEGRWEPALSSFSSCRDILKREEARVGKVSYGLLLLWAQIPLAQMYQLRGGEEGSTQMLQKAVETWGEIVEGIMPVLMDPDLKILYSRLLSFLYTAQYDCGFANEDPEMKALAVQSYAELMGYERDLGRAERELCLLLSYDYYWSGSFKNSLKWIREANFRLWRETLPPATYLRWECYVLMKLKRFREARSTLDGFSSALRLVPAVDVQDRTAVQARAKEVERRAAEVRRWKQDCDMQMDKDSTSDCDLQELNDVDNEIRQVQYAICLSVEETTQDGNYIEAAPPVKQIMDEMLTPDFTSVRSWLSASREHIKCAKSHVSKLPEALQGVIEKNLHTVSGAFQQKEFGLAIWTLNICREALLSIKKCIENEAYYSILASVDHLLADLYQFCSNNFLHQFEKALEIRKELLNCIQHVAPSDKYMEQHYKSLVLLTEYQGCPPDDVSRLPIVQEYASLMGIRKEQAESDMCFWLFFRDNCLWRKLRWLENQVMPKWMDSGINHSLSYQHLMRGQVELCLETVEFLMEDDGEQNIIETVKLVLNRAEGILNDLVQRFECQSMGSYIAWVHSMLEKCYLKLCKCATTAGDHTAADKYQDMATMQSALYSSLVPKVDLRKDKIPSTIDVSNRTQLIQVEEHIMEESYWIELPSAHYLALQKLYGIGRYAQDEGDWERAIFNLELCRDLLKGLKEQFRSAKFDSSLAWVDVPLVQLYQMKMKNLKKSLDLRNEVRECLGSFEVVDPYVQLTVHANLHAAIYLYGHFNYPKSIDKIMDEIMQLVPERSDSGVDKHMDVLRQLDRKVKADEGEGGGKGLDKLRNDFMEMAEFQQLLPELRTDDAGRRREFWEFFILLVGRNFWEYYIVTILLYWHFVQGDYETALYIIGVMEQVVNKYFPGDQEKIEQNVVFKTECFMELKMFQDAELIIAEARAGRKADALSRRLQVMIQMYRHEISGLHVALFESSKPPALYCMRILGVYLQLLGRYRDAAYFHTQCIKIIDAAKNDPSNRNRIHQASEIITEHRGQPGWYDYFHLGISHRKMFETNMRYIRINEESLWTHPQSSEAGPSIQDQQFTSALTNFQQQIKLVVNPDFIARGNHEILKLYAAMDESYFGYLLIKHGLNKAHAMHLESGTADMNDVELVDEMKKVQCNLTPTEQSFLEEVEANMIKYGRRASIQFANSLYAMKGKYAGSWINVLEGHKDIYAKLQRHYLNKIYLEGLTTLDYNPELQPKLMDEYRWKAFLYAERQRSRVLLYQLGPQKLTSHVARQLWEFDTNDLFAMETIQAHVAALEENSVFVEFNHLQDDMWVIYVVQAGKLSHYLLPLKLEMEHLKKAIKNILSLVAVPKKGTKKSLKKSTRNKDLEYLHNLLIKPIASHLDQMETANANEGNKKHKLILAPSELLTKVPFAALQDCTRLDEEKYLAQRHTIFLEPSLRAFQRCNERLEALQKFNSHELGPGTIVALGDPTYGRNFTGKALDPLPGTKDEVDDIRQQFQNIPGVVTLVREQATAENLLQWVGNHRSSRQLIVHIGAHGKVDEQDERNSCLFLAGSSAAGSSSGGLYCGEIRSRMDGELDIDDSKEDDEVDTENEELMEILSGMVNRAIGEGKEIEKGKDEEREEKDSKGKDEGKEEKASKGKDKGKKEEDSEWKDDYIGSEISLEEVIERVEKKIAPTLKIVWNAFVEHPELLMTKQKTEQNRRQKTEYSPHEYSVLTLEDISDSKFPWQAELVVLSACRTSEGRATAEGLVNLARAFIIAGVPCVVATQWAVLDDPSAKLMKGFYNSLRHGNDVASSLRSAMCSMIAKHHVREWAPFVSWGSSSLVLPEQLRCKGCKDCRSP